ncbi:AraC family transcriptional regulator [Chitinophaga oryziterrae]|nr:AraC family transcriptional regulator [Chitinophaga oryziterrae]
MATSNNRRSIQRVGLKQIGSNLLQVAVETPATPKVPARSSFAVHSRATNPCKEYISASRRDYYKISLITEGSGTFTLGDRVYKIKAPSLLFINQVEVKTWSPVGPQDGYYCMFTEHLFEMQRNYRDEILHYPLFQIGANAVLKLTEEQSIYLQQIFKQLMREHKDCAAYKQEAIVIYLQLLLLEAKRMGTPASDHQRTLTTAQLLAERFTETLEKQFPIASEQEQVQLKTAGEFAQMLNVHPNHLNATVKRVTGHTTSEHIRQRILLEAKLLLRHTDWHISAIAWCLGFEEPANFTHFFKSQTSHSPHIFRTL